MLLSWLSINQRLQLSRSRSPILGDINNAAKELEDGEDARIKAIYEQYLVERDPVALLVQQTHVNMTVLPFFY